MLVAEYVSNRANMTGSRTYYDFAQLLGRTTHRVGLAAHLCKNYSTTALIEKLGNMVYQDVPKKGRQSIDTFTIEWDVNVDDAA